MPFNDDSHILTPLAAALVIGCSGVVEKPGYRPTPLPADDTELFKVHGSAGYDEVWIFEQGGPGGPLY